MDVKTKWMVQLVGNEGSGKEDRCLAMLAREFAHPDMRVFWHEGKGVYLFDLATFRANDDADLIRHLAKLTLTAMNGLMKVKNTSFLPVRSGALWRQINDQLSFFVEIQEHLSFHDQVEVSGAALFPTRPLHEHVITAMENKDAAELVEYLAYPDQGWIELYWAYEVLCRVRAHEELDVKENMRRFSDTANDRRAGGTRHAQWPATKPEIAQPMTLEEAREFIYSISRRWLNTL